MRKRLHTALASAGVTLAVVLALGGPSCSAAATVEESIWGNDAPSGIGVAADSASVELGTAFSVDVAGEIRGVRYWRDMTRSSETQTATLWSSSGERLATQAVPGQSGSGWQTVYFSAPVDADAGEEFVVSYHAPRGGYVYTSSYHGMSIAEDISIPKDNAGRYLYSTASTFPTRSYQSTNYWVSPVFAAVSGSGAAPVASPSASPTPTPTPTTTSAAQTSVRPGPTTSGVQAGVNLVRSLSLRVTRANTVLNALDISGPVSIEAPGVVITNSRIRGTGTGNGIQVRSGSVKVYDTEISGFENGIGGDRWEAYRVNINSTTGDGVKLGSNTVLANSWIHDLTPSAGAHTDGVQVQSGITDAVVRDNVIDMSTTASPNSAMFVAPDLGPSSAGPLLVQGNYFDGGNYAVQVVDGADGRYFIDNIEFRSNTWGRRALYGPIRTNVPVTWIDNTYASSGAAIKQ